MLLSLCSAKSRYGYMGVSKDTRQALRRPYRSVYGKTQLGMFPTAAEAAVAYAQYVQALQRQESVDAMNEGANDKGSNEVANDMNGEGGKGGDCDDEGGNFEMPLRVGERVEVLWGLSDGETEWFLGTIQSVGGHSGELPVIAYDDDGVCLPMGPKERWRRCSPAGLKTSHSRQGLGGFADESSADGAFVSSSAMTLTASVLNPVRARTHQHLRANAK